MRQRGPATGRGRIRAAALGLAAAGLMVAAVGGESPGSETLATSRSPGEIALGDKPVRVALDAPEGTSVATRLQESARTGRVYLLVSGLKAREQPGVLYHVYLEPAARGEKSAPRQYVGTINFFGAVPLPDAEGAPSPSLSFDATEQVKALQRQGRLADPIAVTIVPAGSPAANARAVIGSISLVAG